MAQKYIVQFVDDLSNEPIEDGQSVSFSFEGVAYSIDLSAAHREEMRRALDPYVSAARRDDSSTATRARAASRPATPKADLKAIREWATAQGLSVSSRGRIPASVTDAYNAAH